MCLYISVFPSSLFSLLFSSLMQWPWGLGQSCFPGILGINLLDVSSANYGTGCLHIWHPQLFWVEDSINALSRNQALENLNTVRVIMLHKPKGCHSHWILCSLLRICGTLIETYQGNTHSLLRWERGGRRKKMKCGPSDKVCHVSWLSLDFILSSPDISGV